MEIDPISHSAWTGGKQKILDKGRVSKFNKNFRTLDQIKIMTNGLLMPMATAVWLVENTSLTFNKLHNFVIYMKLKFKVLQMAVAKGIKPYNPIMSGQLTREEINLSSKDENRPLEIKVNNIEISGQSEKVKNMFLYLRTR